MSLFQSHLQSFLSHRHVGIHTREHKVVAGASLVAIIATYVPLFTFASPVDDFTTAIHMMSDRGILSSPQTDQSITQYATTDQVRTMIKKAKSSLSKSCTDPRYATLPGCSTLPAMTETSMNSSRIETLQSLFDSVGISPASGVSGYADVDGRVSPDLAGYVTKARDIGCINSVRLFRPFDIISQGELIKITACAVGYIAPTPVVDSSWINTLSPNIGKNTPIKNIAIPTVVGLPTATLNTPLSNQNNPSSQTGISNGVTNALIANPYGASYATTNYTPINYYNGYLPESSPDWTVTRDLFVGRNANIGGTLSSRGLVNSGPLTQNGNVNITGNTTQTGNTYQNGDVTISGALSVTSLSVPNSLTSTGNTMTSNVGGSIGTGNIINTSIISSSGNTITTSINGITATGVLINTHTLSASGNILTSETNGVTSTGYLITSHVLTSSGNVFASAINGVTTTGSIINTASLVSSGNTLTASINGVVSTGSLITDNTLSLSGNLLTSFINTVSSTIALISDNVAEGTTNLYYTTARFVADFTARFQPAFDTAFSGKTTDNLAEGTGSLYFTDTRAQNALSGTVSVINTNIATATGDISALSGRTLQNETDIQTLSGKLTMSGMTSILSGATLSLNQVSAGTGTFTAAIVNLLDTITATFQTLTTNIANITTAVIDSLTATTANIATIISNTLTTRDITSTGTANFNNANFSGNVVFNALPILPLTQGSLLVGSNTNTASELTAGGTGQILVILNGTPVWTDAANIAPVVSMFGRTGAVIAQSGDYNTSQVTESGNLYFTPARARATLSSTGAITYDSLTGLIGWNGTTDSVAEGITNLYWTPSRFSGALDSQKNIANGVAGLDANAKVSLVNLPGITMNSVWTATTLVDCTTKTSATRGDICIATSDSKSYVLSSINPANLADWQELLNPAAPVSQVNGQVGNVNFIGTNGITFSGTTASLTNVGSGGIYGSSTSIPVITTDAQGRVTNVTMTTIPTATASTLGLLSPTDYVRFDAKQDMIATGSTSQYYRGDKTWATLDTSVVGENGNLYFTVSRVRNALSATGAITYNSSTGEFGDAFSFGNGLTRSGNIVGISSITGAQLSGFTAGQVLYGTSSGGVTQSSTLFFDGASGRLGVGTSAPTTKLSLNIGTFSNTFANLAGSYIYGNATNASGFYGYAISMDNTTNGNAYASFNITRNSGTAYLGAEINSVSRDGFRILTGNSTGSLAEVFRINNSGQVGIGITAPTQQLDVKGAGVFRNGGIGSATTGNEQILFGYLGTTNYQNAIRTRHNAGVIANNAIDFYTWQPADGAAGLPSRFGMTVNGGNVGIGTTTPIAKLSVSGGGITLDSAGVSTRPALNVAGTYPSYEIRSVGDTANPALDAGFLRLSAGGGTGVGNQTSIDLSGFSGTPDMNNNMLFRTSGTERMRVTSSGNVGIGTSTPAYKLQVSGDINANGVTLTSDARFKTSVSTITNSTDIVSRLNPVTYVWNTLGIEHGGKSGVTQYGFLAQDVESILPSAVSTSADGYKSLNYIDFIPHLVGAVKELITTDAVMSGSLSTLSGQVALLSQNSGATTVVNNNYYSSGTTSSGSSSSWVDTAFSFVSSLIVRVEATFSEMVTFVKSVVFRSTVTFEDRVIFSDKDMAGTATIRAGERSVRVEFSRPYSEIPRVTVTADAFVTYRVTDKMVTGFTIETQSPVSTDTNFDWMALMVRGLATTTPSAPPTPSSGTDTSSAPSNTGSTDTGTGTGTAYIGTGSTLFAGSGSDSGSSPATTPVLGCMDSTASNYSATATQDDGSCIAPVVVPDPVGSPAPPTTGSGS